MNHRAAGVCRERYARCVIGGGYRRNANKVPVSGAVREVRQGAQVAIRAFTWGVVETQVAEHSLGKMRGVTTRRKKNLKRRRR